MMKVLKESNTSCIVETTLTTEELQFIFNNRDIPAKAFYTNKGNEKKVEYSSINYRTVLMYLEDLK